VSGNSIVTPDGNFSVTVSIGIMTFNPDVQKQPLNPEDISSLLRLHFQRPKPEEEQS
jgi:hypothetical protein